MHDAMVFKIRKLLSRIECLSDGVFLLIGSKSESESGSGSESESKTVDLDLSEISF